MKLHQLVQFIAIAEHDTLRAAAESLYISEPALSRNLAKLESELGCALFERTPAGLRLNEFGEVVLRRARSTVRETELMRAELEALKSAGRPIRFASCHGDFCACAGDYFARKYPDRSFEAITAPSGARLLEMIRAGECDIAFPTSTSMDVAAMVPDAVKIYDEQVLLTAPSDMDDGLGEIVGLEEMRGLRYVLPRGRGRGVYGWSERLVEVAGIPEENISYVDIDYYMRNINDIDGYSLATSSLLSFLKHDNRRVVTIDDPCARESIYLAVCVDDEDLRRMARELQVECGGPSGMNYFLAWISSIGHSDNLEIVNCE